MTKTECEELNNMVCGSSLCREECYYRRKKKNTSPYRRDWRYSGDSDVRGRLIYDGNIFRCSVMEYCSRITPKTGKLIKYLSEGVDELKKSILYRRVKLLKSSPEFTTMKLVRGDKKFWIDVDGQEINPKWFNHSWWTYKWICEDV